MKAIYTKLKNHVEHQDTSAVIVCSIISLTVFFIMKVLSREIPL
jgi:hypothetical protein